jgi:hypothetical protein
MTRRAPGISGEDVGEKKKEGEKKKKRKKKEKKRGYA